MHSSVSIRTKAFCDVYLNTFEPAVNWLQQKESFNHLHMIQYMGSPIYR